MAPALVEGLHLHLFYSRATGNPNNPPLASVFALVIDRARYLASGVSRTLARRKTAHTLAGLQHLHLTKRQSTDRVLVIPTTYANLNDSPAPGAVVGITLGAVFGFLLALFILIQALRAAGYGVGEEIVEEEIIRRHSHSGASRHQSVKHSVTASSASSISAPAPPPPVMEEVRRTSRRESRRTSRVSRRAAPPPPEPDEVIVEEEMSSVHEPDHVVVEEEEDDIVEVIEEHSPEPPPRASRKSTATRRSGGFRTVDPAEYGGGDAPSRRVR